MSNESLHIDDLLSNSFAGFEPAMPAMAWEGIASKLDSQKRRGGFAWWKAAAVGLLLIGAWFAAEKTIFNKQSQNSQVSGNNSSQTDDIKGTLENQNNLRSGATEQNNGSDLENKDIKSGNQTSGNNGSSKLQQKVRDANALPPAEQVDRVPANIIPPAEATVTETWSQIAENDARGIGSSDISSADLALLMEEANEAKEVANGESYVKPFFPKQSRIMFGFGVGQVISNTNYSVVNSKSAYVHRDFTKLMSRGEGILSAMSVNASVYYKLNRDFPLYLTTGISYFQRRNSLNFDFDHYAPLENLIGTKQDKFGYYPFGNYDNSIYNGRVTFKGTNSFSQIEIPLGLALDKSFGNSGWSIIPTISANLGFITQKTGYTLDYHELEVTPINPTWYRSNYFSMNSSLGIYKGFFSGRMKLGVNGSAGYMLTPMYVPGASVRPKAFTGGLSTQLIWRID